MAVFSTGTGRAQRGGSPGFRFTLYAVLSIIVMFLDQRHGYLEAARYLLQAAAYPFELAVSSPSAAWHWLSETLATRDALESENRRLKAEQHELALRALRFEALLRENGELRALREALPPLVERWLPAEIVDLQLSNLRQRVIINRGTRNGVFKGQTVLDDRGVIGQTTHVGPWSAEVILITDAEHAIPVQIERTGLRTIAVGAGESANIALPYLPANADVKSGDLLLTSGLGGIFPAGYPVARISEVHRDAIQPLAQVRAVPVAHLSTDREVVLVWFKDEHPAAPTAAAAGAGELPRGNAALQPQHAPKPKPASAAAAVPPAAAPVEAPASSKTASPATAAPQPPEGRP